MKILIEDYRGFEIMFDTESEKFQSIITESDTKESGSFAAVKKFIDDYKKLNQGFAPFLVEPIPERNRQKGIKIIGIRKDGRLIGQDDRGEQFQISDYETKYYMLVFPENENALSLLNELDELVEKQRVENNEKRKQIISTMKIITLQDYKEKLK